MMLVEELKQKCAQALNSLYSAQGQHFTEKNVDITAATNSKFGHFQCNSAMKLTKTLSKPPRVIAEELRNTLLTQQDQHNSMFSNIEVAGPGFINFSLSAEYLSQRLNTQIGDSRLGCPQISPQQRAIVDFSSPNIAKEMHVGHLRSTIIGDCIARTLEFLGYDVLRLNHVGDWGTQFGMLITYLRDKHADVEKIRQLDLSELLKVYRAAKLEFDANPEFKLRAQKAVVELQSGDSAALQIWQAICNSSRIAFEQIYKILDINIQERGESFYNPYLPGVIADLEQKHLITVSDGAKCVYLDGFTNREGEPLPLIVQKSDGGYNYATTDMAALKHRVDTEHGSWLIYVTDAGQSQHFNMVFAAARLAGYYDPAEVRVDHVPFGLVLRADGKKFQTRAGDTERLIDLLQSAIDKARQLLQARDYPDVGADELQNMAEILGINAVKYADLACHRTNDYVFNLERMLQFEGNTAAFVCYAYVRVQSIKRKIGVDVNELMQTNTIKLQTAEEIDLGLQLLQFAETVNNFTVELLPHRITEYLYTLAEKFHVFFHNCRVEGTPEQNSRILLCEAVSRVLAQGLNLLGLKPLDKM
jgi:arginyl-tRNA synthetase